MNSNQASMTSRLIKKKASLSPENQASLRHCRKSPRVLSQIDLLRGLNRLFSELNKNLSCFESKNLLINRSADNQRESQLYAQDHDCQRNTGLASSIHAKLREALIASSQEIERLEAESRLQRAKIKEMKQKESLVKKIQNQSETSNSKGVKQMIEQLQEISETHPSMKEGGTKFMEARFIKHSGSQTEQIDWKEVANQLFKEIQSIGQSHQKLITNFSKKQGRRQPSLTLSLKQSSKEEWDDSRVEYQRQLKDREPSTARFNSFSSQSDHLSHKAALSRIDTCSEQINSAKSTHQKPSKVFFDSFDYAGVHSTLIKKHNVELDSDLNSLLSIRSEGNLIERAIKRNLVSQFQESVLSAKVDYLKDFKSKEHRVLYIRGNYLYFFFPETLTMQTKLRLSKIKKLSLIRHSSQLILIEVNDYHPYLLQSLFCFEIALFLANHTKKLGISEIEPVLKSGLLVTKKGSFFRSLLPPGEEAKSIVSQHSISYESLPVKSKLDKITDKFSTSNALKRGVAWVLKKHKINLGQKVWKEQILVLTNIGLLIFQNMQDQNPFFFPIASAFVKSFSCYSLPSLSKKMQPYFPGVKQASSLDLLELHHHDLAPLTVIFNSEHERSSWEASIQYIQEKKKAEEGRIFNLSKVL